MTSIKIGGYEREDEGLEDKVELTVGVFFDGTGNNRKNVRARKIANGEKQEIAPHEKEQEYIDAFDKYGKEDSSYFNDESNVSRLELSYLNIETNKPNTFKVYTEGIGTEDLENDKLYGTIAGKGSFGVKEKVKNACKEIIKKIKNSAVEDDNGDKIIHSLTFDCYGFSRGAAAARYFIYQVKQQSEMIQLSSSNPLIENTLFTIPYGYLGEELYKEKTEVKKIIIRFVGLYDTVASYGIGHRRDVKQLEMNHLYHAKKVVHLTAQDEIRENFKLTTIRSAHSKGVTISLPGAHSDIGGGYLETLTEENLLVDEDFKDLIFRRGVLLPNLKEKRGIALVRYYYDIEGWYREKSKQFSTDSWYHYRHELIGKRGGLTNAYSAIPLQIMANFSEENEASINIIELTEKYNTNDCVFLKDIQERIEAEIEAKKSRRIINCLLFNRERNLKQEWRVKKNNWENHLTRSTYSANKKALDSHFKYLKKDYEYIRMLCGCFKLKELKAEMKEEFKEIKHKYRRFDKHTVLQKPEEPQESQEQIPEEYLEAYNGGSLTEVIVLSEETRIKELRNRYLHVSHHYGNSALFEPHKPNPNYKREILEG